MQQSTLLQKIENRRFYNSVLEEGFEYLLNPDTGELHRVARNYFQGPHNLEIADLPNFIPCINIGTHPVHLLEDGTEIPFYDHPEDEPSKYRLNKCQYCFPSSRSASNQEYQQLGLSSVLSSEQ